VVAAYWFRPADMRHEPPVVTTAAAPIVIPPKDPVRRPAAEPGATTPQPHAKPQTRTEPASRGLDDSRDAVQRARVLAQRPDVKGLVALREEVLRRADVPGGTESPATKQQLDEIDRYLAEARALRLKLDAAEFRKGAAVGIPPR
jgi:hypothetical protein